MDTTSAPRTASVCDARSPLNDAGVAWRRVTFLDGSGRGDVDDWLAVGGAPDASACAPLLARLGPRRVVFLDGSRAVTLPPVGGGFGHATWPAGWAMSRYGAGMAGAAAFYGDRAVRAAVARAAVEASGLRSLRPALHREALGSIDRGGVAGLVIAEADGRLRHGSARFYAASCAWGAVLCAATRDRVRASQAAARAFHLAVTARAVAVHADGRPLQAALTFQAEAADVLRAFLPWHALLESLVAAAGAPPPKAADIGGRYSPGLLRLDGHGAPFEDIG